MPVQAHATAKYVRTSAQKAGLVMDLIRGREVNAALATLRFARKSVAKDIEKVLRSAIANATLKEGFGGDVERLYVDSCYANQGPSQKRIRPAPMGRAFRVVKRTAHLTVRGGRASPLRRRRRRGGAAPAGGAEGRAEARARRQAEGEDRAQEDDGEEGRNRVGMPRSAVRGPQSEESRISDGTESTSARLSARLQQDLALALVRRQGTTRSCCTRISSCATR